MNVKAVGQASAHRTDSGSAASGGSGQQQSTMQISVASWVPPLSGDTAEAQFLKSLVTGGLLNRDPNQQIPLDHHVAENAVMFSQMFDGAAPERSSENIGSAGIRPIRFYNDGLHGRLLLQFTMALARKFSLR